MGQLISKVNINIIENYKEMNFLFNRSYNFIFEKINLIDYLPNPSKILKQNDYLNIFLYKTKSFYYEKLFNILSFEKKNIKYIYYKQLILLYIIFSNLKLIKKCELISMVYDYNKSGYLSESEFYLFLYDFVELINKLISKKKKKITNLKESILNIYKNILFLESKIISFEELYKFIINDNEIIQCLVNLNLFCNEELYITTENIFFKFNKYINDEIKFYNKIKKKIKIKNNSSELENKLDFEFNKFNINIKKIFNYDTRKRNRFFNIKNKFIYSIGKLIVIHNIKNNEQNIFTLHKEKIIDFIVVENNIYSLDLNNTIFVYNYKTLEYKLIINSLLNYQAKKLIVSNDQKNLFLVCNEICFYFNIASLYWDNFFLNDYLIDSFIIYDYPIFDLKFDFNNKNIYILNLKGLLKLDLLTKKNIYLIKNKNIDVITTFELIDNKYYLIGTLNGNISYYKQEIFINSSSNWSKFCINSIIRKNPNEFIIGDQSGNIFLINLEISLEINIIKSANLKKVKNNYLNNLIISLIINEDYLFIFTENSLIKTNWNNIFENFEIVFQIPGSFDLNFIDSNKSFNKYLFVYNKKGFLLKYNIENYSIEKNIFMKENINKFKLSEEGNILLITCNNGKLILLDAYELNIINTLKLENKVDLISLNKNGEFIGIQDIKYNFYLLITVPNLILKYKKKINFIIKNIDFSNDGLIMMLEINNNIKYYDSFKFIEINENNFQIKNELWSTLSNVNYKDIKNIKKIEKKENITCILKNNNEEYFWFGKKNGKLNIGNYPFNELNNLKEYKFHSDSISNLFNIGKNNFISFSHDKSIIYYNINNLTKNFNKKNILNAKNKNENFDKIKTDLTIEYKKDVDNFNEIYNLIQINNKDNKSKNNFNYDIKLFKINDFNEELLILDSINNQLVIGFSSYLQFYSMNDKDSKYIKISENILSCFYYDKEKNLVIGEKTNNLDKMANIIIFDLNYQNIKFKYSNTKLNNIYRLLLLKNKNEIIFIGKNLRLNWYSLKIINYISKITIYKINLETDNFNDLAYYNNNIIIANNTLTRINCEKYIFYYKKLEIDNDLNEITSCTFAFKKKYLIIGSKNGYLTHYNNFEIGNTVNAHLGEITILKEFNENVLFSAGSDGKIRSWYISNSLNKDEVKFETNYLTKKEEFNSKNYIKIILFENYNIFSNSYKQIKRIINKDESELIFENVNYYIITSCINRDRLYTFDLKNELKIYLIDEFNNFKLEKTINNENLITSCVSFYNYILVCDELGFIGYFDLEGNYEKKKIKSQQISYNIFPFIMKISKDNLYLSLSTNSYNSQVEVYELSENLEKIKFKTLTNFSLKGKIISLDYTVNNNLIVNTNLSEIRFYDWNKLKIINHYIFKEEIINQNTLYFIDLLGIFQSNFFYNNIILKFILFEHLNLAFLINNNGKCAMYSFPCKISNGFHKKLTIFEDEIMDIYNYKEYLIFISRNFSIISFELTKLNTDENLNLIDIHQTINENLYFDQIENKFNYNINFEIKENLFYDENMIESVEELEMKNFNYSNNFNWMKYLFYKPNLKLKLINIYGKTIYNEHSFCFLNEDNIAFISHDNVIINDFKLNNFKFFKMHEVEINKIKNYKNFIFSSDISGNIFIWNWKNLFLVNKINLLENIIDFNYFDDEFLGIIYKREYFEILLYDIKKGIILDSMNIKICKGPLRIYFSKENRLLLVSLNYQIYINILNKKLIDYNYIDFEEFNEISLEDGKEFFWIDEKNQFWVKKKMKENKLIKQKTFEDKVKQIIEIQNSYIFLLFNNKLIFYDKSFNYEGEISNLFSEENLKNILTIKKNENNIIIFYDDYVFIKIKEEYLEELKNQSNIKYDWYNLSYTGNNNRVVFKLKYEVNNNIGLLISENNGSYYFFDLFNNKISLKYYLKEKNNFITYIIIGKKNIVCSDNLGRILLWDNINLNIIETINLKDLDKKIDLISLSLNENLIAIAYENYVFIYEFYNYIIKKKIKINSKVNFIFWSLCNKFIKINDYISDLEILSSNIEDVEIQNNKYKKLYKIKNYEKILWDENIKDPIFNNCKEITCFCIYEKKLDNINSRKILIFGDKIGYINICYYPYFFENQKLIKRYIGNYEINKMNIFEKDKKNYLLIHGDKNSIIHLYKLN